MAKKPNYDFERTQRERAKSAKKAAKLADKAAERELNRNATDDQTISEEAQKHS